jgi:hypothetical protein
MKTASEIPSTFPALLRDPRQDRFQAASILSTPRNTSSYTQKPTFPQKCSGYTATFRAASSHATYLNKTTYIDLPQAELPKNTPFPPVKP